MINFDVTIYQSAVALLIGDKPDLIKEILHQLYQGDSCLEDVAEELAEICEERGLDEEAIVENFEAQDCEELMKYISFTPADIEFNYAESYEIHKLHACRHRVQLCGIRRRDMRVQDILHV